MMSQWTDDLNLSLLLILLILYNTLLQEKKKKLNDITKDGLTETRQIWLTWGLAGADRRRWSQPIKKPKRGTDKGLFMQHVNK